ncbi:hypothetical protein MHYP_G00277580 [Metynnis hypsauchen]
MLQLALLCVIGNIQTHSDTQQPDTCADIKGYRLSTRSQTATLFIRRRLRRLLITDPARSLASFILSRLLRAALVFCTFTSAPFPHGESPGAGEAWRSYLNENGSRTGDEQQGGTRNPPVRTGIKERGEWRKVEGLGESQPRSGGTRRTGQVFSGLAPRSCSDRINTAEEDLRRDAA